MSTVKETIKEARLIRMTLGGYIGGSYSVDPDTANDIDIFLSTSHWDAFLNRTSQYRTDKVVVRDVPFVDSFSTGREYYESNNQDGALDTTYRSLDGLINLIVVQDDFLLAFKISLMRMTAKPELYKTKEARVALHHHWRGRIRTFLSDSAALDDTLHGG